MDLEKPGKQVIHPTNDFTGKAKQYKSSSNLSKYNSYKGLIDSKLLSDGIIKRMFNNEYGSKLLGGIKEDNRKTADPELPKDKVKISENKKLKKNKVNITEDKELKEAYINLVETLIRNMIKIFLIENGTLFDLKNVKTLNSIAENIFLIVKNDETTFLYESMVPEIKLVISDKVSKYQMLLNNLIENISDKNIKTVLEYIKKTKHVIKEAEEFIGNDVNNNVEYKANNPTLMQLVSLYGSTLNLLKDKIESCNNSYEDISQIASCQLVAFENAMATLSNLIDSCGNNEDCRTKILKAIGRLEQIKSSVENIINNPPE